MYSSARGHTSPYSLEHTWEGKDVNLLTGNWANWLSMSREHWWDCGLIMDDAWLLHPEKELSIFSVACAAMSLSTPEIYEKYNLHLSTRCWTAELHMTHRNTILNKVLSTCLSSRRFTGNSKLPWGYAHCVCSWFNRIPFHGPQCIHNKCITWEQRIYIFIPSLPPGKLSLDLGQSFKLFIHMMFGC